MRSSSGPRPARISSKIIEVAPPIAKRAVSAGRLLALAGVLAPFLEEGREAGQRCAVALPRVVAGGGHLDHRHPRDVRLGGEQLDQRPQPGRDPLRPGLAVGRLEGAPRRGRRGRRTRAS